MNIPREIALEIFGLTDNFDENELKNCYTNLSKIIHPDSGGDEKLFNFVTKCKNVLENNTDKEEKQNSNSNKGTEISVRQLKDIYDKIYYYSKKLNIEKIYTEIELCLIPIENKNDMWSTKYYLYDSLESFLIRDGVVFEVVVKIPEELKEYNKLKVEFLYNGKKVKFKICKTKRYYHYYIDKARKFKTYIDFQFVWD